MSKSDCKGFTLLETLVVILLMSLLAAFAAPAASAFNLSFYRRNAVQQVSADLRRAKTEALEQGVHSIFMTSANGSSYTLGFDYLPYQVSPAQDTLELESFLPNNTSITASRTLIFDSRGFLVDQNGSPTNATLVISGNGAAFCSLTINAIGSITTSCPQ